MDWPRGKQAAAHDKHAERAFERLLQYMTENRPAIIQESKERLTGLGFDQYQDQSFGLTLEQLETGAMQELCDGVNYFVIALARGLA